MSCGSLYRGACRAYRRMRAVAGPVQVPGRIRTSLATPGPGSADQSGGGAPLHIRYCLRRCHGAPRKSGSTGSYPGGVPERPKGADCKSAGSAFPGSNPGAATLGKTPSAQVVTCAEGVFRLVLAGRFGVGEARTCLTPHRPQPTVESVRFPRRPPEDGHDHSGSCHSRGAASIRLSAPPGVVKHVGVHLVRHRDTVAGPAARLPLLRSARPGTQRPAHSRSAPRIVPTGCGQSVPHDVQPVSGGHDEGADHEDELRWLALDGAADTGTAAIMTRPEGAIITPATSSDLPRQGSRRSREAWPGRSRGTLAPCPPAAESAPSAAARSPSSPGGTRATTRPAPASTANSPRARAPAARPVQARSNRPWTATRSRTSPANCPCSEAG